MTKLEFRIRNGKVFFRTNQERIADSLCEIRDGLRKRTEGNARVWSQGFEDNQGFEHEVGLLENLERCTRGAPSWQMAMAIEIAFQLGKAAATGKVGQAAYAKYEAGADKQADGRLDGSYKGGKKRQDDAAAWHKPVGEIWERERSLLDPKTGRKQSMTTLAQKIRDGVHGRIAGLPGDQAIRKYVGELEAAFLARVGNSLKRYSFSDTLAPTTLRLVIHRRGKPCP
jgi:hypothetical protein